MKLLIITIFTYLIVTIRVEPSASQECECGLLSTDSRVYKGSHFKENKYPWLVYLKIYDPDSPREFFTCGGALISDWNVITAAHCLVSNGKRTPEKLVKVYIGAHSTKSLPSASIVKKYTLFYRPGVPSDDMAIIELESPVKFTNKVLPICMLDGNRPNISSSKLVVAGWGATGPSGNLPQVPSEAEVDHIPTSECQKRYNRIAKEEHQLPIKITDRLICALNRKTKADSCNGDSGSGLMYRNPANNRWYLVGNVAGSTSPCGKTDYLPGGYVNVIYFEDFIAKNSRNTCSKFNDGPATEPQTSAGLTELAETSTSVTSTPSPPSSD